MIGFERKANFSEILIFKIKIYSSFHCMISDQIYSYKRIPVRLMSVGGLQRCSPPLSVNLFHTDPHVPSSIDERTRAQNYRVCCALIHGADYFKKFLCFFDRDSIFLMFR